MAKPEITSTGITVQTFDEVFAELVDAYKTIYGQDINLDQDSPDGQRIGITAKMAYDLQAFGQNLYSNLDPDLSSGQLQNILIKFNGISRRPATRSQKDITITTDRALTLPVDFTLKDNLDQIWGIDESVSLTDGSNSVTFYAKNYGAVESLSTATFTPQLIVTGILTVTSDNMATVGQDEESDEALRIRRNNTFENAAYSTVGGLLSKLINLSNVTDAIVYENDSDTQDTDKNMPAHSIWCIVQGGSVADIIECITKNKTAGVYTKGDTSGTYTETITKQDGSAFSINHIYRFDRPKEVELFVELTVKRKVTVNAIDLDSIKTAIASETFPINGSVDATELYAKVYSVDGQFTAYDLKVKIDGGAFTDKYIQAGYDEYFTIKTDNITISEIV